MEDKQEAQDAQTVSTAFKNYLAEITLVNGEKMQLPRLTGKRIVATSRSVSKLIRAVSKEMPEKFTTDANSSRATADIVAMIFDVLPTAIEHVIPVVADYLSKTTDEIGEWELDDIMSVAGVFFLNSLKSGNTLLSQLGLSPRNFVNFVPAQAPMNSIPGLSQETMNSTPSDNSPASSTPSEPIIDGVQGQL